MHGRNTKSAVFPPRIGRDVIQANLTKIADCIRRHDPDIVTLQEIDEHSIFSGGFNQVEFMNNLLKYSHVYFAPSRRNMLGVKNVFITGNAIFSKFPLSNMESHIFEATFPNDRMGFVIVDAQLPNGVSVTVTSIHTAWIDWLHRDFRARELTQVANVLGQRSLPTVVAGDFNCDLLGKESSLRDFMSHTNLCAYEPSNSSMNTYPTWRPEKRIDWILTSKAIRFDSYEVVLDQISDHVAVFGIMVT